jgi:hypothetical protein
MQQAASNANSATTLPGIICHCKKSEVLTLVFAHWAIQK